MILHDGFVPTLDITPLRSLHAVAQLGGVHRAAEALHLSPAAVSGHLRRLEREVGLAVVMRQGRQVALTIDGQELLKHAESILDSHDRAVRDVAAPDPDELVVAATEHAAQFLVPELVQMLRGAAPGRPVRLRLTRSAHVRDLVSQERADVAVFLTRPAQASTLVATLPVRWLGVPGVDSDALVLFTEPCSVRRQALEALGPRPYRIVRECPDLTTVLSEARSGSGVTPLPRMGPRPEALEELTGMPGIGAVPLYVTVSERLGPPVRTLLVRRLRELLSPKGRGFSAAS